MPSLTLPCPILVGRKGELNSLYGLIDQAAKGQGGVALISGEAGIGKSRLVATAKNYSADHNFLSIQGNCFPADGTSPYGPILETLRFLFDRYPWTRSFGLAPQIIQVFQSWFPHLTVQKKLLTASVPLTTFQAPTEKRQIFELLANFLTGLSERQPLLLVIEDLHWSDQTSLELLHFLAHRSTSAALLFALSYRSEELTTGLHKFLALLDREHLAQEIHLGPLSSAEVEAMLQNLLALSRPGLPEVFYALYPLSEGNPFFIEELLKAMVTAGELFVENDRWTCHPLTKIHLPRSVRTVVQQRLLLLSNPAQDMLKLASVVGRRFDFELLLQLTQFEEQQLLKVFKEVIAAQLVVEDSTDQFAFRHALIRETIYAELLGRERQVLHHQIARALEERLPTLLEALLSELTYHFYEAGDWDKTLAYGQRAGEKALKMYSSHEAIDHLTKALIAAGKGNLEFPASIYLLRGQGYEMLGDFDQALCDFETALTKAKETTDLVTACQAQIDLGLLWAWRDYATSGSYCRQALELARQLGDLRLVAHSLNRLGNWHLNIGQPMEAVECHRQALSLFEKTGDLPGIAETSDLLGLASYMKGDLFEGASYFEQAVRLFRQVDDQVGLVSSLANLVIAGGNSETEMVISVAPTGRVEAINLGEEALKLARETGQRSAEVYALCQLALRNGTYGDYDKAFIMAEEAIQLAENIDHRQWLTYGRWLLGNLYLDILALPQAQTTLNQAVIVAREIGSAYWLHTITSSLGWVYIAQENFSQAQAVLNSVSLLVEPPRTYGERLLWGARAKLALSQGQTEQALNMVEQLIATVNGPYPQGLPGSLLLLHGETLLAVGRTAEAEQALQTALTFAQKKELPPLLWRIYLTLSRLFQTGHRYNEVRQANIAVQEITQKLSTSVPEGALREHFLHTITARLPSNPSPTPRQVAKISFGGLTEREREVAWLIAQGRLNSEIASELVVGIRTVESHVSNIRSKLGLTSRTQIALWVREIGLER